jgi:RNA polymerase subunit RPABC4/transcription elongation factor Spt4
MNAWDAAIPGLTATSWKQFNVFRKNSGHRCRFSLTIVIKVLYYLTMEEIEAKKICECKVTYFIGRLLAKAGILTLRDNGLIFTPTALDRALGAIDIPIPLEEIQGFTYNDTFQKTLQIKTPARTHRFIGSSLNEMHENLIILKRNAPPAPASPAPVVEVHTQPAHADDTCPNCSKIINPLFKFCPYCKTQLKILCPQCKEPVAQDWTACPFCNTNIK